MKLDNLLGPYLYRYKKLNLPGIGTFEADASMVVPEEKEKHAVSVQGISFTQHSDATPDEQLIEFIKSHTGKMRPLALADLESFLMLVKQFVNIGKPFYIEGIGTLQKATDGSLKFTPGVYISPRSENNDQESTAPRQESITISKTSSRKIVFFLAAIITLAVIGWGGYYLYKINTTEKQEASPGAIVTPTQDTDTLGTPGILPDSSMLIKDPGITDTTASHTSVSSSGTYTFVLETTSNKARALYRYNHLHKFSPQLQLQVQKDSSLFKLLVVLPVSSSDTVRIKDSLNAWYYGKKEMKIQVEQ